MSAILVRVFKMHPLFWRFETLILHPLSFFLVTILTEGLWCTCRNIAKVPALPPSKPYYRVRPSHFFLSFVLVSVCLFVNPTPGPAAYGLLLHVRGV